MKVLVINAGSSSLKYQLMDPETGKVFAKGLCERIGLDGKFTYKPQVVGAFHRQNLPQLLFHLQRVGALAESQQVGDADAVGVADDAARDGVQVAQQQICGFSPHAG